MRPARSAAASSPIAMLERGWEAWAEAEVGEELPGAVPAAMAEWAAAEAAGRAAEGLAAMAEWAVEAGLAAMAEWAAAEAARRAAADRRGAVLGSSRHSSRRLGDGGLLGWFPGSRTLRCRLC